MVDINRDLFFAKFFALTGQFSRDYQKKAIAVANDLLGDIDSSKDIQKSLDKAWEKNKVTEFTRKRIESDVVKASAYGYGVLPEMILNIDNVKNSLFIQKWDGTGLNLSQKLHKLDNTMKTLVADNLRVAFKNKEGQAETARRLFDEFAKKNILPVADVPGFLDDIIKSNRKLDNSKAVQSAVKRAIKNISDIKTPALKRAYADLVNVIDQEGTKAFNRAINKATREKARYHAERIARTEYSRAYGDGMHTLMVQDEDVIAIRRRVSAAHAIDDICDVIQHSDFYGMGAGVYPKDKVPSYPSHPHCNCRMVEVYIGAKIGKEGKYNPKSGTKYLNSVSNKKQDQILGKQTSPKSWEKKLDVYNTNVTEAKNLKIKTA